MHIIELRKLAAQVKKLNLAQDGVARWGRFMLDPTPATLAELRVYSPVFEEVKMVMAEISASERARLLADSRQKGRLDQLQRELDAERRGKTEGWAEGRAEGEARGLRTAALGMLKKGSPLADVAEILQMSEAELTALLASDPASEPASDRADDPVSTPAADGGKRSI